MYDGTIMINAGFDQESGNKVIKEGNADLVAYAKLYISNPDLVERFRANTELAEWDKDTFYTPGKEGYTDYPKLEAVGA
jgi:N-ethylmaleimide reductase